MTIVLSAVGAFSNVIFLTLVDSYGVSPKLIYIFIGILIGLFVVYAFFSMKEVTKTKDFEVRRERSDTQEAKKRASYVIKQGFKLIFSEP